MTALPPRQLTVLRYLQDAGRQTAGAVTAGLRTDRTTAQNALRLLTAKGLVSLDFMALPATYTITDRGRTVLADAEKAAAEAGES